MEHLILKECYFFCLFFVSPLAMNVWRLREVTHLPKVAQPKDSGAGIKLKLVSQTVASHSHLVITELSFCSFSLSGLNLVLI